MFYGFIFKNKKFKIKVIPAVGLKKIFGLMFTKKEKAEALLFELKKPLAIHSFFVFYPFIAIWLNNNKVIAVKKIKPFTFHIKPKRFFNKIIEIPINNKYKKLIQDFKLKT